MAQSMTSQGLVRYGNELRGALKKRRPYIAKKQPEKRKKASQKSFPGDQNRGRFLTPPLYHFLYTGPKRGPPGGPRIGPQNGPRFPSKIAPVFRQQTIRCFDSLDTRANRFIFFQKALLYRANVTTSDARADHRGHPSMSEGDGKLGRLFFNGSGSRADVE